MSELCCNNVKNPIFFGAVLTQDLQNIATCISLEEFTELLKVLNLKQEIIKKMHKAMQDKLNNEYQNHLKKLLQDEDIIDIHNKYNDLMTHGIRVDGIAWRPPGDVKEHMRSFDVSIYKKENDQLQKIVMEKVKTNELMMKQIMERRNEFLNNERRQRDIINKCKTEIHQIMNFNDSMEEFINNVKERIKNDGQK